MNRLLSILGVATDKFPLTYTFYRTDKNEALVIPPFHDNMVSWRTLLPSNIFDLVDFNYVVNEGKSIINTFNTHSTIEQFVQGIPLLSTDFKDNFLYPFLAAGWGAPLEDFKMFAAYDILTWSLENKPTGVTPSYWTEIVGGAGSYIQALVQQLEYTRVKLSTDIVTITPSNQENGGQGADGYTVVEADGTRTYFDHLVLATNGYEARQLLKDIPHALDITSILRNLSYFHTTIAVHGDTGLMPYHMSDWSVINVRHTGKYSLISVYKSWKNHSKPVPGNHVFRSWISHDIKTEEPLPRPLYALREYYHPKVDIAYFQVQKALEFVQGNHNIWLGGLYTYGVDSHDSAIISAVRIAKRLDPDSSRLQALTRIELDKF